MEIRAIARETVFIVQPFRAGRGARLFADPSVACKSELTAVEPQSALRRPELV